MENIGAQVCTLKFGIAWCRVVMRKNNGAWMCALNLALRMRIEWRMHNNGTRCVHMHNNGELVCADCRAEEFCWCTRNVGICCHATI
jgi:hypothetical protein